MRVSLATILLSPALLVAADRMEVYSTDAPFISGLTRQGTFKTDFGSYSVDARAGCRGISVPGMVEFCVDWSPPSGGGIARAHFRFDHQVSKRCMVVISHEGVTPPDTCTGRHCPPMYNKYWLTQFEGRGCTW